MADPIFVNAQVVALVPNQVPLASLNHDFLLREKIITEDLTHQKEHSFSTSEVSQVRYKEGLQFVSEPQKLSIIVTTEEKLNLLEAVASKCIKLCSGVQGVGLNFLFVREDIEYPNFASQFLRDLPHYENKHAKGRRLAWSYELGGGKFLNVAAFEAQKRGVDREAARVVSMFEANMHYASNYTTNKVDILSNLASDCKSIKKFIGDF